METALWNLVLDDLLKVFKYSDNIKAFADDVSLLSTGKNICGIKINTKNIVDKIMKWCNQNSLEISTLKTKVIFWSKTREKSHPKSIKFDGHKIKISKTVKYLGVTIDNKLNWNDHIQNVVKKCKKSTICHQKSNWKQIGNITNANAMDIQNHHYSHFKLWINCVGNEPHQNTNCKNYPYTNPSATYDNQV